MVVTGFFHSKLWRVLKWLSAAFAILLLLFGIVSWIVFENKNAWLLDEIQSQVNEAQSGELEISTIDLKLFKNFPHVTLELDGVNYYEHKDSLRTPTEKLRASATKPRAPCFCIIGASRSIPGPDSA